MKAINIIKLCLDAYKAALKDAPNNSEYHIYIRERDMNLGVCWYIENRIELFFDEYWIKRHCSKNSIYWCEQSQLGIQYLQKRVEILEKEYNHHKKWGFLARFIKP